MKTNFGNYKILGKRNLIILGIMFIIGIFSLTNALEKEIIIQDGHKQMKATAFFTNVGGVLKKKNIVVKEHDQVFPSLDSKVKDGMKITLKRAQPIRIQVDGKKLEVMTAKERTIDILKEHNISIGYADKVEPKLNEMISQNKVITVVRVNEKFITSKEPIPYENIIKYNDNLDKGKIKLIQKGVKGEKEITYRIVYEDGKETSRQIMEEKVLKQQQNEIVEQGTAQYVATSRGNLRIKKSFRMTSTAYTASYRSTGKRPGDRGYGITKMGTRVKQGVVAVDPRVIPLGTRLYIKSLDGSKDYGIARAEDIGGAIKGNKVDLYFSDSADARRYGKRPVMVYILR